MIPFDPLEPRLSDEEFDAFLQLCQEQYLELLANDAWLWPDDSPNHGGVIESDHT